MNLLQVQTYLDFQQDNSSHSTTNSDFQIGEIVFGKYRILSFIASGGGGRVYKANDTLRNVDVALKVLLVDNADPKSVMKFQREAQIASKLKHPNIATVNDFGLFGKTPYLSLEFVPGESLDTVLERSERLDLETFYDVFLQLANAVSHAHKNGVVHRDLKPANVIVDQKADGKRVVKVLDFGVAKLADSTGIDPRKLTTTGGIVGSPLYMSPEQADGREITLQSDLYSLGAMMFKCLTGEHPLQADSAIETIMLVAKQTAPSIQDAAKDDLPAELCDLVDNLLRKQPGERPALDEVVIPTITKLSANLRSASGLAVSETEIEIEPEPEPQTRAKTTYTLRPERNGPTAAGILSSLSLVAIGALFCLMQILKSDRTDVKAPAQKTTDTNSLDGQGLHSYTKDTQSVEDGQKRRQQPLPQDPDNEEMESEETGNSSAKVAIDLKSMVPVEEEIDLQGTDVTDKDLLNLQNPRQIRKLRLSNTKVSNLVSLPRFKWLKFLTLGRTTITDQSLENISNLRFLQLIDLHDTKISDKGLPPIEKMTMMFDLNLSKTSVTSDGLKKVLKPLICLRRLEVKEMNFSPADIAKFAGNIAPNCMIFLTETDSSSIASDKLDSTQLASIASRYPDLCFNQYYKGPIFEKRERAARLLEDKNPDETRKALQILWEVIDHSKKFFGPESVRARGHYLLVGDGELVLKNYRQAIEDYKIAEKLSRRIGDRQVEFYAQKGQLTALLDGGKLRSEKDLRAAHDLLTRAVTSAEEWFGYDSREAMGFRTGWAGAFKSEKTCDIVLPLYQRALRIEMEEAHRNPRLIAYIHANLGDCYFWLKKKDLARRSYKHASDGFEKFGP
jgi:serine/threonine protein kinase/tetratricopeptide (TPR) repeat protein